MTYNELIECINILSKKKPNLSYLEQLENTKISDNIIDLIVPKLVELIKTRTNYSIQNIIHELDTIFNDINILDYQLVKFKKEITIINRLLSLKHLPIDIKTKLKNTFKEDITNVYQILKKEANIVDYTGSYELIIKNNEYKWSE